MEGSQGIVHSLFRSWNPVSVRPIGAEQLGQEATSVTSQAWGGRMGRCACEGGGPAGQAGRGGAELQDNP